MIRYGEDTPIEQRSERQLVVSPANSMFEEVPTQFMVVERFWDEMAGNYWGPATGAPKVFDREEDAERWLQANLVVRNKEHLWEPTDTEGHSMQCTKCNTAISIYERQQWDKAQESSCME